VQDYYRRCRRLIPLSGHSAVEGNLSRRPCRGNADLFKGRLSQQYADRAPRVARGQLRQVDGDNTQEPATAGAGRVEDPDGPWCDARRCLDIIIALVWALSPRSGMRISTFQLASTMSLRREPRSRQGGLRI
jgi:hypothetical protein